MSKSGFNIERQTIPTTPDYECFGKLTGSWVWDNFLRQNLSTKKTDTELLRVLVALYERCAENDPLVAIPIGVAWINHLADLGFPATTRVAVFQHSLLALAWVLLVLPWVLLILA